MNISKQEAQMVLEMIESSNISGKAIELFSEFKKRISEFLQTDEVSPEE